LPFNTAFVADVPPHNSALGLMKRPRPSPPEGVPVGTTQLGGPIDWFSASLHVSSEDLDPDRITELLGRAPSRQQRKGVLLLRPDGSPRYIPRFGRWSRDLQPLDTDEWDVSEVVRLLFEDLPASPEIWSQVKSLGRARVALGLSLGKNNQEFEFEPELLQFLADRSASIWFDIYGPDDHDET
jgi:Domain of unknown function (DUF4279)